MKKNMFLLCYTKKYIYVSCGRGLKMELRECYAIKLNIKRLQCSLTIKISKQQSAMNIPANLEESTLKSNEAETTTK